MKKKLNLLITKTKNNIKKRPLIAFFIILAILFGIIFFASNSRKNSVEEEPQILEKTVNTFNVGETPRIQIIAKVENSRTITLVSQASGIVQKISAQPGDQVSAGKSIFNLSTNYYGGNSADIQVQIAEKQYQNLLDNFDQQKEVIAKQRDSARLQKDNADELRKITQQSIQETEDLLKLNESLLDSVNSSLSSLDEATQSSQVFSLKSQKSQLLSGINQIKSGLRQAKYQGDENNPVFQLAQKAEEIAQKQLDLQEKSLEFSKELTYLQTKLARVQSALFYPASPRNGVIERILVREGQLVNPGTPLAVIRTNAGTTSLIASVPKATAEAISISEPTFINLGANGFSNQNLNFSSLSSQLLNIYPSFISTVPTENSLFSVQYVLNWDQIADASIENFKGESDDNSLAEEIEKILANLADRSFVELSIPVGSVGTNSIMPFLPLESIHQSNLESTIYVLGENNIVESMEVKLGSVQGRFVEILSVIPSGTQVILNRDVVEGQKVKVN